MSKNAVTTEARSIRLQAVGWVRSMNAGDLKPGMTWVFNYGYTAEVLTVTPSKTGATVTISARDAQDGQVYTVKRGTTSQVVAR
jgi:translation elongation factor P/translation initiation factor 5A